MLSNVETLFESFFSDALPPTSQFAHAQRVAALLHDWQIPENFHFAALFTEVANNTTEWEGLKLAFLDHGISDSDLLFVEKWRHLFLMTVIPKAGAGDLHNTRSLKLRELMRAAYLNLPLVMLTLADHQARVENNHNDRHFWHDTETIFLPLLRMLGLWQIRRDWLEKVAENLYPNELKIVKEKLAYYEKNKLSCFKKINQYISEISDPTVEYKMDLRSQAPGRVYYRCQKGESLQELSSCVTITICMERQSDCYRMLEWVHQLGIPIQGRLIDRIAIPEANGFRAMQTAVICNQSDDSCRHKLIEFRIVSEGMHELNQMGVIEAKYRQPQKFKNISAWWDLNRVSTKRINNSLELLHNHKIGTPVEENKPIYVFTPQGEIKTLLKGSTALDFAYSLHTQIGHHCRGVQINGEKKTYGTILNNGDLIFLEQDPFFNGPDPSWLHLVHNNKTKEKIKQGLSALRQRIHPGRQLVERFLDSLRLDSDLVIPAPQLEKYYFAAAKMFKLENARELFDAIVPPAPNWQPKIAPDLVVSFILEAELAAAVLDENKQPIIESLLAESTNPNLLLKFCPLCKPAPGSPIVIHIKRHLNRPNNIVLHRVSKKGGKKQNQHQKLFGLPDLTNIPCEKNIPETQIVKPAVWGEVAAGKVTSNLTIVAEDRSHLVGDILEPIYNNDRINLTHIEANADPKGDAHLLLTVETDDSQQVLELKQLLDNVPNVYKTQIWPANMIQGANLRASSFANFVNPYHTGNPIRETRMLFGREREMQELKQAFSSSNPVQLMTMYGHKRSGKTSIALLCNQFLDHHTRPVYINLLLARSLLTLPAILFVISRGIYEEIYSSLPNEEKQQIRPPEYFPDDHIAIDAFYTFLEKICEILRPHRLLLILDEFNLLVSEMSFSPAIFDFLKSITVDFDSVSILLITHQNQFLSLPNSHPAKILYSQGIALNIDVLEPIHARELIIKPVLGYLEYNGEVVNQIVTKTNGQPYLINLLCYEIVKEQMSRDHRHVTSEVLKIAEEKFLKHGETYFHFAIEPQDETMQQITCILAMHHHAGTLWVPTSTLAEKTNLPISEVMNALTELQNFGVIRERINPAKEWQINIEYFSQWAYRNWYLPKMNAVGGISND